MLKISAELKSIEKFCILQCGENLTAGVKNITNPFSKTVHLKYPKGGVNNTSFVALLTELNGPPQLHMSRQVSAHKQQLLKQEQHQQQIRCDNRTRKALRTITIILGAFACCFIPWHVLSLIIGFACGDPTVPCVVPPTLYDISYWLCYLNSPINPFCYAFANQQFKKTFIRILRLDWRRS